MLKIFNRILKHIFVVDRTVTKCSNDLQSGIRISKMRQPIKPAPIRKISSDFTNPMAQRLKRNGTDKLHDSYFGDDDDSDDSSLLESGTGSTCLV